MAEGTSIEVLVLVNESNESNESMDDVAIECNVSRWEHRR